MNDVNDVLDKVYKKFYDATEGDFEPCCNQAAREILFKIIRETKSELNK